MAIVGGARQKCQGHNPEIQSDIDRHATMNRLAGMSNRPLNPRYPAIVAASPDLAWARARAHPHRAA